MKYPPIADIMVVLMVSKDEVEVEKMSKNIVSVIKT